MTEVSRSQTLRDNERIKHFAGAVTAWANALVIGGFGAMIVEQKMMLGPTLGILGGFVVVWICSMVLTMLKAQGEI